MAQWWLHTVPPDKAEELLYRAWVEAGCPLQQLDIQDVDINTFTAHQMGAIQYLTWDAQIRKFMELRNLLRDPESIPAPSSLQSSSLLFEQHLFTKLKLLMAQREHLLERFLQLLRIISIYDDILLDIEEGCF
jgi:hypothetical protein